MQILLHALLPGRRGANSRSAAIAAIVIDPDGVTVWNGKKDEAQAGTRCSGGNKMADKPNDPVQLWHSMLAEMEKGFNAMATQVMGSEQFSKTAHQLTGASVGAQKTMGDMMERYLVGMNMPSRAQMVSMGERLQTIEAQLNEIKAVLYRAYPDAMSEDGAATSRPPRTRQPPSAGGSSA